MPSSLDSPAHGRRALPAALLAALVWTAPTPALAGETVVLGDLPRRPALGVSLAPSPQGHAQVVGLQPGGSAEAAGLRVGDALLGINDVRFASSQDLGPAMRRLVAGSDARFLVLRDGAELAVDVAMQPRPMEASEEFDVVYDVVQAGDARLRAVVTKPSGATERLPAVLFLQGLTCTSIEEPRGMPPTIMALVHGWTRAGYCVMRCEKSGLGDSTGTPCSEIDFETEAFGFQRALEKLRGYPFVDTDRVFLFGHSMGGIVGPVIAQRSPVRGVMVFGTGVLPWGEYLVQNERRQARLAGTPPAAELEDRLRRLARLQHHLFVEDMELEAVVEAHPDLEQVARQSYPDGEHGYTRHLRFFRELADLNMCATWSAVDAHVLALYGEYDWVTAAWDHEYIAEIVNDLRPGTADWYVVPRMFHGFDVHESLEASFGAPFRGPFGDELLEHTLAWMARVSQG